jgi:hypothetical protein
VCLDFYGGDLNVPIGVSNCHHGGGTQLFRLNIKGELANGENCIITKNDKIIKRRCFKNGIWNPIGEWIYDDVIKSILI